MVCDLEAIGAERRPRYQELAQKIFGRAERIEELPDGYCYRFREGSVELRELAEWMEMESRCCGFLRFRVEVDESVRLTLRGPEGVKAILATALRGGAYEQV